MTISYINYIKITFAALYIAFILIIFGFHFQEIGELTTAAAFMNGGIVALFIFLYLVIKDE